VLGVTGGIPLPRDPDDVLAAVSASYRLFDDQADLMQAGPVSHLPAEQR
jgi:hypothetical protein